MFLLIRITKENKFNLSEFDKLMRLNCFVLMAEVLMIKSIFDFKK